MTARLPWKVSAVFMNWCGSRGELVLEAVERVDLAREQPELGAEKLRERRVHEPGGWSSGSGSSSGVTGTMAPESVARCARSC